MNIFGPNFGARIIFCNYERHGVGLTLESYQTYSTYYDSGVGTGVGTDTAIGHRRTRTRPSHEQSASWSQQLAQV